MPPVHVWIVQPPSTRNNAPTLFAYLRRQTASSEDAEDLLVEVFLVALERDQLLAVPQGARRRWLFGVAQHKLTDHYRRLARRPFVPLDTLTETLEEDAALAPEQLVLRQEAQTDLRGAAAPVATAAGDFAPPLCSWTRRC